MTDNQRRTSEDLQVEVRELRERLGVLGREEAKRRQAEEALRQSRYLFEALVNSIHGIVWEADARTFQFSFVSQQAERLLGYAVERWLQEPTFWKDHLHPEDRDWAIDFCIKATAEKRAHDFEYRMLAADGHTVWLRDLVTVVVEDDRPVKLRGVMVDVTAHRRAEEKLQDSAKQLQSLSHRLLQVQESERRYLARELHDEIGQSLTGLKLALEMGMRVGGEVLTESLVEAQRRVRELTTQIRDLSLRLRPTMLDDLGLLPALLWHFDRYTTQTRVQVQFQHTGLERRFPAEVETAAYRIIQEAVTNVARHAGVDEVTIRIWLDNGTLCLQIEDHGKGFDPDAVRTADLSTGLSGMRERATLLKGHVDVESIPGLGTRLTAFLPIPGQLGCQPDPKDIGLES